MLEEKINILSIESSCDDTSAAVIANGAVLSNEITNQTVHEAYGGVVPELASRAHQQNIIPVVDLALKKAKIDKDELSAIAFTRGPGLLGSLIVGVSFAKAMALSLDIPLIEVHHMHAHVMAHFAEKPHPKFPFLCLTVSGGHSQIVLVKDHNKMEVIGSTIDDAAGEAFDKAGKMLGLPYPAGPIIDKYAKEGKPVFKFTKSKVDGLNYSFSGLKTAILYFLRKQLAEDSQFIKNNLNDLCASIQAAILDMLLEKFIKASDEYGISEMAIAGGVSANSELRKRLAVLAEGRGWNHHIPSIQFCTDNAAMIGVTAYYKYLNKEFVDQTISAKAKFEF